MVERKFVQRFPAHEDPALSAQLYQTGPESGAYKLDVGDALRV